MTSVDVKDLRYQYHDGLEALRGINLSIEKDERVCIAGPNGAGKSTLLHCLAGLLKGNGQVSVANAELKNLDSSIFGLVFQNPDDQLFCPTLGDDIAFGPRNQKLAKDVVAERVRESLALVGLEGFEYRHPHHLSIGEKKRAAIAAVMACKPKILALDEPWANLDARASRSVTDILKNFDGTVIVISQDLYYAAAVCKRMVVMDGGMVIADGDMKKLLAQEKVLEYFVAVDDDGCPLCHSRTRI
ncbi:MAG: ABC transporter ATP-binding protein [Gammaproteobacteria bacterium]|nr:ABC transporter ATP-binding protein [Gammaproteobacteria bacterium]